LGHNFSRVQVQANTPTVIQPQSLVAQPEEQQQEEEADSMVQPVKLMAPPVLGKPIQREADEDEPLQMRPQFGFLTPVIQREADEDEPIQMMPQGGWLQRLPQEAEDDEPIQMKPQLGLIQRQEADEEPIQMMPQLGFIQRQQAEADEEPIQMMPQLGLIQRQEADADEEPIQMKRIQLKVVVGQPGDKYEQEADSVAAQVMSMSTPPANSAPIQRQGEEEEQEPLVQRSSLADSITPLVQRQTEEQEEPLQTKSLLQRVANGNALAGSNVESQLNSSKGGGSPLPDEVRSFMEPRFGVDFSSVRVHTDSTAVQMNKDLGAQAFAHGSDIYFGAGKSPAISDLTAHELTHVVQQTGAKTLQRKLITSLQSNKETLQAKINPAFSPISIPEPKIQPKENPQQLSNKEVLVQKDELPKGDTQTLHVQPKCAACAQEESVQTIQPKENPQQQFSNKDELPKGRVQTLHIQPKCAACSEEEQVQRQPLVGNTISQADGNTTVQAFGWEDVKNTASAGANWVGDKASAGANWVGDKASQVASLGKDAFASLVARVAPGLADLIRSGPVGLLTEKIKEGIKGWLSGVMANVDVGSVITSLKSNFAGVFETIKGLGKGDPASCKAFAQSIKSLQDMGQAFMDSAAIKQLQGAFTQVSGIFKKVSDLVIAPAFDALMSVAGGVFNAVKGLATTIWQWGAPVRNTLGAAWDWVKQQLGFGGDGEGGILNWLKTKASEVWTQIKGPLAPVIGPLKTVGTVLLAFSPVGMFAAVTKFVPQLVQSVQWLWAHKDDPNIVKSAHEQMGKTILPGLLSAVQGFSNAVQSTVTGLVSQAVQLNEAVLGLLGAITGVPLLSMAQSLVQTVSNGVKELVAWGQEAFQAASQSVIELFGKIKAKIEPYAGVLGSLGLAIVNPAMIPVILAGSAWRMLDDCYKAPIINFLLDTVIGLLKAAPSLPMFGLLWPMLKAGVIGFLEGVKGKPDNEKVAITNKLAKIISGGSPAFILGFVKGLIKGIWEGLTDPFVLIYEAIKGLGNLVTWLNDVANQALSPTPTGEKPASAQAGAASPATATNKNVEMGQRMQQMAGELEPPVQQVSQGFMPAVQEVFSGGGGMSFEQLMQKLGDAWAGVETAIRNAGGTLADKVCQFMLQDTAEGEMGETVGWLAGTIAFEVVLGILTAGSWTAAKGAMKGLKLFAKILDWTGEAMGLAFKGLAKVGGFILDGIKGLGKLLDKAGGAAKAILDALGDIGQKLISFADELLGRAAKGAAGEVVEEGAEKATNQAIKQGAGEVAEKFGEKGAELLAKHGDEGAGFLAHYGDDALNVPANQIDDFLGWKKKLTPETQQFFKDNPELWRVYADMDPDVRKVLTLCNSPCIPPKATTAQAERIKGLLSKSGLPGNHPGLKKYFHSAKDLDAAISKIDDLAGQINGNALDALLNNKKALEAVLRNPDAAALLAKHGDQAVKALGLLGDNGVDILKKYDKISHIPGATEVLKDLGVGSTKTTGAIGEIKHIERLLDEGIEIANVGHKIGGQQAADIVLADGKIIDVKYYDWNKTWPFALIKDPTKPLSPSKQKIFDRDFQKIIDEMVDQVKLRKKQYPGAPIEYAFKPPLKDVPVELVEALKKEGVQVVEGTL
jgi:hypothetical protein